MNCLLSSGNSINMIFFPRNLLPLWIFLKRRAFTIGALILCFFHCGCFRLSEVDSTHSPFFARMLGNEFELLEEFIAIGVKGEYPSAEITSVLIMPRPGQAITRFLVELGRVPAGSRFKIVGVVTRTSKLFPSIEYAISFKEHSIPRSGNLLVRIPDGKVYFPAYVKPISPSEAPTLNERYFRPIGGTSK